MQRIGSLVPLGIALLSLTVIACTRANPDYCDRSNPCIAGICDLDGLKEQANSCLELDCVAFADECLTDGTRLLSCDPTTNELSANDCGGFGCDTARAACNECRPNTVVCEEASGMGELTSCGGDGTITSQRDCFFGCRTNGTASCIDVDPSNGLETDLDYIDDNPAAIGDLILEDGYTVNSDGTIRDDNGTALATLDTRSAPQGGDKSIRVFRVRKLTITGTVTIDGSNEAVAFVADDDIEINGTLLVKAGDITDVLNECFGDPNGGNGSDRPGSGGGGFGTAGLPGGDAEERIGGIGGLPHGTAELQPLVGGCGSNAGDNSRGGGALQLVSRTKISLSDLGRLGALGEGGASVSIDAFGNISAGGGSGGALLLEAPVVEIDSDAFISANGGGGGGGCLNNQGQDGRLATVAALGANCAEIVIGSGGNGAALTNATAGGTVSGLDSSGGGGGGGAGRVRINTGTGTLPSTDRISPIPSQGMLGSR